MRILSICCTILLITMCIIMQQQSIEAKPFIFKFFVPQAPARDASGSTSSPSSSSGIDICSLITTKLNLLSSFLQAGLSKSISVSFGKFFPSTPITTTKRPKTSTTNTTPSAEIEPESTIAAININIKTAATTTTEKPTTKTTTTTVTEISNFEKSTQSVFTSEVTEEKVITTEESLSENLASKVTTDNTNSDLDLVTGKYEKSFASTEKLGNENSDNNNDDDNDMDDDIKVIIDKSSTDNDSKVTITSNVDSDIETDSRITTYILLEPTTSSPINGGSDNIVASSKVGNNISVGKGYDYKFSSKLSNTNIENNNKLEDIMGINDAKNSDTSAVSIKVITSSVSEDNTSAAKLTIGNENKSDSGYNKNSITKVNMDDVKNSGAPRDASNKVITTNVGIDHETGYQIITTKESRRDNGFIYSNTTSYLYDAKNNVVIPGSTQYIISTEVDNGYDNNNDSKETTDDKLDNGNSIYKENIKNAYGAFRLKPNVYKYTTTVPKTIHYYDSILESMGDNEISNEVMMVNNEYLPAF